MQKLFYRIGFWNQQPKPFIHEENNPVNTLAAGLIQAVRKKQLIRTWLCG